MRHSLVWPVVPSSLLCVFTTMTLDSFGNNIRPAAFPTYLSLFSPSFQIAFVISFSTLFRRTTWVAVNKSGPKEKEPLLVVKETLCAIWRCFVTSKKNFGTMICFQLFFFSSVKQEKRRSLVGVPSRTSWLVIRCVVTVNGFGSAFPPLPNKSEFTQRLQLVLFTIVFVFLFIFLP